jgi:hypothetical protein
MVCVWAAGGCGGRAPASTRAGGRVRGVGGVGGEVVGFRRGLKGRVDAGLCNWPGARAARRVGPAAAAAGGGVGARAARRSRPPRTARTSRAAAPVARERLNDRAAQPAGRLGRAALVVGEVVDVLARGLGVGVGWGWRRVEGEGQHAGGVRPRRHAPPPRRPTPAPGSPRQATRRRLPPRRCQSRRGSAPGWRAGRPRARAARAAAAAAAAAAPPGPACTPPPRL